MFFVGDQSQNNQSIAQQTELAGLLFIIVGTNVFLTTFFVPAIMEERFASNFLCALDP